ncbi:MULTISPECIES: hypothetical protein [Methylomonas]|nr:MULTISPECIES: hypothetical protein [Methylomonas]TCV88558.1 hypothetical protein EDE11_101348 [Methylomonas methanica]
MNSYPIEIAWYDQNGNIESHLINPYTVDDWIDWDYNAQQIHGISRKLCGEQGVHPKFLCHRMNQSIQPGETIYADGIPFDDWWIETLYSVGSSAGFAEFNIVHSDSLMLPLLTTIEDDSNKRRRLYEQLKLDARKKVGGRHRARIDVQYLIELFHLCSAQTAIR